MSIIIRSEHAPRRITLVIHMGTGAVDSVVSAALRNYGEYRAITRDGLGIFAVSVFAVAGGVTEQEILGALPQRSFAQTTVGAVTDAGFELVATSVLDPELEQAIRAIQPVHYDIALPPAEDERLETVDPVDDDDLEEVARNQLRPHVERLLAVFGPRERK